MTQTTDHVGTDHAGTEHIGIAGHQPGGLVPGAYWWARMRVAQNPNYHLATLIANDPSSPAWLLKNAVDGASAGIRSLIAEHCNTGIDVLERLAFDPEWVVRLGVARRSGLSEVAYQALAYDDEPEVAEAVAANPAIGSTSLWYTLFALGEDDGLRWALLRNPNAPLADLACVINDDLDASHVARNPNCPTWLLAKIAARYAAAYSLARNGRTPPDRLEVLYREDRERRRDILQNPACPRSILEDVVFYPTLTQAGSLGTNVTIDGRKSIVENPGCPLDLLETIWESDATEEIKVALVQKPWCPQPVLEAAVRSMSNPIREAATANPHTDARYTALRARDLSPSVRRAAYRHPDVSGYTLMTQGLDELIDAGTITTSALPWLEPAIAEVAINLSASWTRSIYALLDAAEMLLG